VSLSLSVLIETASSFAESAGKRDETGFFQHLVVETRRKDTLEFLQMGLYVTFNVLAG
jgi:hypothetical protein